MNTIPRLCSETFEERFKELKPPMSRQEALVESSRCLFCFDAPCIMACPSGIDVPAFIKKIANGNPTGAARAILEANILGASCARVCPTQVLCEGACVLEDRDEPPIQIGRLQRYATDFVAERGINALSGRMSHPESGKKVAVIGAGPAGLSCAAALARLGHKVVVFEAQRQAGGLNTYGIAYYKMRPQVSLEEVELVRSLGVEIICGVRVGQHITVEQIESSFDAMFIGIGLGSPTKLGIPGEDLAGVMDALEFISRLRTEPPGGVSIGKRVAVIGAGNTAIDAVTQALRLGAESATVIYRRSEAEMSAYGFEYELAQTDGAAFLFNAAAIEIVGEAGETVGVRLVRTRTVEGKLTILPDTVWTHPVDTVLLAVGQEKQVQALRNLFPRLSLDRRGVIEVNGTTGQTSIPHIFSGGDCANGGREVVNAVGEGKKAAHGIHEFLVREQADMGVQPSRLGMQGGASGAGIWKPIRAHELEAAYHASASNVATRSSI